MLKRIAQSWRDNRARHAANEIELKWTALVKQLPRSSDGRLLLHIGCGEINTPYFVNVDARPLPHVHIVTATLFRLDMIPDKIADMVYMSHVLEHVSHRDIVTTLREMQRILKSGGMLRISVPDFDKIIDIYKNNKGDINSIEQPLMGGQDYPENFHYSVFNAEKLSQIFQSIGMKDVRAWGPNICEYHDFTDWANRNHPFHGQEFPISLNMEATAA